MTNGRFLSPFNLINLTVQAVSVAIIATGMTLVIVSRNIDLSVGSIVGIVAMADVLLMTQIIPNAIGRDNPATWIIALVAGLVVGGLIGAFQGGIIAYIGVPSFIALRNPQRDDLGTLRRTVGSRHPPPPPRPEATMPTLAASCAPSSSPDSPSC